MTADVTPEAPTDSGQQLVDGLVALLDLERIEENIFRGLSPKVSLQRVFGGQVAGQALVAAGRTVEPDRAVHSLHAYFIRGGDPSVPIVYTVDRVRDGRSFSVRRVLAIQHGQPIFTLSASFQLDQGGREHGSARPDVAAPESLPTLAERMDGFPELRRNRLPFPFDLRYVDDPPWVQRAHGPRVEGGNRVWMRATGRLPDDPLVHVCALTFASDLTLLDAVLLRQGVAWGLDPITGASLDHAVWFHYESESPSAFFSLVMASC